MKKLFLFSFSFILSEIFTQSIASNHRNIPDLSACKETVSSIEQLNEVTDSATGSNPYALIAGGSKGIGYAIAEALARRKYNLVAHSGAWIASLQRKENWSQHTRCMWRSFNRTLVKKMLLQL